MRYYQRNIAKDISLAVVMRFRCEAVMLDGRD